MLPFVLALLHGPAFGASGWVFPAVRAVPLPGAALAFEVDGQAVAVCHYGTDAPKPYVFPFLGPASHRLTSLAHPVDPEGHCHHRSIWVGHRDVGGANFWEEKEGNRVVFEALEALSSGTGAASARFRHRWETAAGETLLLERREVRVQCVEEGQRYLDLRLEFTAAGEKVTLGKTPFGFLGLRVAPTMAVRGGAGRALNAEGAENEAGTHWKRSRWLDYAGPVAPGITNGVAVFDHPENPRFPTYFHVRDDGWVGASFCYAEPYDVEAGNPLVLRYRVFAHGGLGAEDIETHWERFAAEE